MEQLIRRAAEALLNLGITSREVIEPRVQAWIHRPPDYETHDEDSELAGFLTELFKAKIISRSQGRTLLAMLTERAQPPADDPYIGRRFGSFIAEERVGEGAMGKVYRATREGTLERNYVIKVFDQSNEETAIRRFRREGDVMSRLDHPNIVKVMGSGQEGGAAFLVLEYCEGPTLAEMLLQRGKFSWTSATRAVKQIAGALSAAHEKGVIHRDVKPQNIVVAPGGMLKVLDFGLAKTLDSHSSALSQAGEILGSPAFMAPEQWGDHQVDERADLFSLGVIYYLLVSGETPFKGRTPADYSWKIREGTYAPVSELIPEVPLDVQHVIDQLLERDRAWRTPSASRLISNLDRILHNKTPNLPRLELIDGENAISRRFYLVGKPSYRVGNDFEVEIFVDHPSIEPEHARLDRSEGMLLTAHGETLVNGKKVREIVLRDKDLIVFGEGGATLRYRVGNLGRRTSSRVFDPSSDRFQRLEDPSGNPGPPVVVWGLLVSALAASAHPRTMVHCFEGLDTYTIQSELDRTRACLLHAGFSTEVVEQVLERADKLAQEAMWKVADTLFTRTKENLGRSVEAWLQWWFEVRQKYPPQFMPPVPRAGGEVKVRPNPDDDSFVFDLLGDEDWVVGRSEDCELTVNERSVSRQHLRLHRLNRRYAYVDLGSRFGTTIGENRVSVGLLRDADSLRLGRAKLRFKDHVRAMPPQVASGGPVQVDAHSFRALVDVRSPSVVLTLIKLLDPAPLAQFCAQALAPHEPPEKAANIITAFLGAQRELALEALPAITSTNLGDETAPWQQWWQANQGGLGPQVEPAGWGA